MDPLVAIDGIQMGCDDENDDHILEAAVNGQVDYVVTQDKELLNLPAAVRARLEAISGMEKRPALLWDCARAP